jgi:hypothetical protein
MTLQGIDMGHWHGKPDSHPSRGSESERAIVPGVPAHGVVPDCRAQLFATAPSVAVFCNRSWPMTAGASSTAV